MAAFGRPLTDPSPDMGQMPDGHRGTSRVK